MYYAGAMHICAVFLLLHVSNCSRTASFPSIVYMSAQFHLPMDLFIFTCLLQLNSHQHILTLLAVPTLSIDTTKERAPPPQPTPLDFPRYSKPDCDPDQPCTEESCNALYHLLSRLKKPQDVTEAHLRALNVKVETDVKFSDIVPGGKLESLAPYKWPEGSENQSPSAPGATGPSNLLSNGYPIPNKEKYDLLKQELLFDNDDAFRAVARMTPLPGRPKIRVTHSRKFWTGLENLAQYWDSSLDKYVERSVDEPEKDKQNDEKNPDTMDIDEKEDTNATKSALSEKMDIDETLKSENEAPKTKQMYMGRRIGTGKDMPEAMREETLRGFLEMVAWSFGCQIHIPSLPPRLLVKGLLFPVRHTFTICRSPKDRQEARKGIMEGPLLLAQCRGETSFHKEDGTVDRSAEVCDIMREAVGMLLFAQERARQDAVEVKPGEGKWWATEPRWGGAPNDGPVVESEANDKDNNGKEANGDAGGDRKRSRHSLSRRGPSQRKLSVAEKWKLVQPGPSTWDRKLRYMQIGKDQDTPCDDVRFPLHFTIQYLAN